MFDISKVDNNFEIETQIDKKDIKFFKIDEAPFKIYGVFKEKGKYRRMPDNIARKVSEGVYLLHTNTAGGRVRFTTDSPYIAIHAKMDSLGKMSHFALTGSIGFDLYVDNCYAKTFVPPFYIEDGYESIFEFETKKEREITINFPLYSDVCELYIGLEKGAKLENLMIIHTQNLLCSTVHQLQWENAFFCRKSCIRKMFRYSTVYSTKWTLIVFSLRWCYISVRSKIFSKHVFSLTAHIYLNWKISINL